MFLRGLAKGSRFRFQGLQTEVPQSFGVVFGRAADLHALRITPGAGRRLRTALRSQCNTEMDRRFCSMVTPLRMILADDFQRQWPDIEEDALAAFRTVGESGWYILGTEVREFEAALAAYWGIAHAAGVASGLDALEISLRVLGCQSGDSVLATRRYRLSLLRWRSSRSAPCPCSSIPMIAAW